MSATAPAAPHSHRAPDVPWLGLTLAILGAAFFATKGIVIKLAMIEGVDAIITLTWRMIVAVPIFVTVGIIGVLMVKVIPEITSMFSQQGKTLPLNTRMLIATSGEVPAAVLAQLRGAAGIISVDALTC